LVKSFSTTEKKEQEKIFMNKDIKELIKKEVIDFASPMIESKYQTNETYMRCKFQELGNEIRTIKDDIPANVDIAVEKYVNGHIKRLSAKVTEMERNESDAHRKFTEKLAESNEILKEVKASLNFLHTLNVLVKKTAVVVGSLSVIAGAFWAFIKFIIFNAK